MIKPTFPTLKRTDIVEEEFLNIPKELFNTIKELQGTAASAKITASSLEAKNPNAAAKFQANQIRVNELLLDTLMELDKRARAPKLKNEEVEIDSGKIALSPDLEKQVTDILTRRQ